MWAGTTFFRFIRNHAFADGWRDGQTYYTAFSWLYRAACSAVQPIRNVADSTEGIITHIICDIMYKHTLRLQGLLNTPNMQILSLNSNIFKGRFPKTRTGRKLGLN